MNKYNIQLVTVFLFLGLFSIAQETKNEYPTFNKEMAIGIGKDSIAVYALIASGKEPKETVILLHGIPGNERNLDLAQDLRKSGKNVVFFNYRGSWGSQGKYLYSNCLEDVDHVINHFSDINLARKLRIDTSKFVLIGHSLGGGIALIKGTKDRRVKKVVALSAFNIGYWLRDVKTIDSRKGFQKSIKSSFMLNCNPKEFVQEIIDNKVDYNVLNYKDGFTANSILIIDNYSRVEGWPGKLGNSVEYHIIESDHSFTNKRIELSDYIIQWLEIN